MDSFPARPMSPLKALLWPSIAAIIGLAILIGLGVWQLQRLTWKENLLHEVAARTTQVPVAAPAEAEWPRLLPDDIEYRRVRIEGTFNHADEVHVFTALSEPKGPRSGPGYWIMTPLTLADGSTIIINRGFVPMERQDQATRMAGQVSGKVAVVGLMRSTEDRNYFTPADEPAKNEWFTRDPAAIAAAEHLSRVAPFFIDAQESAPGGLPQGGETTLDFPNNHLQYAGTWFGLALTLVGVYIAFIRRRLRPQ